MFDAEHANPMTFPVVRAVRSGDCELSWQETILIHRYMQPRRWGLSREIQQCDVVLDAQVKHRAEIKDLAFVAWARTRLIVASSRHWHVIDNLRIADAFLADEASS